MHDSEMMVWGAFRYLSSLTMILGTLIYDTRASLGTTGTVFSEKLKYNFV